MIVHKTFGLDLGTTNSTAATFIDGKIFCAEDAKRSTIPSIVARKKGEFAVGSWPKNHPEIDSVKSVKRLMGKNETVELEGVSYAPEEISAQIIKHCATLLNCQIEKPGNVIYDQVVITIPAYFSVGQKDATRKAGELAGLDVKMLLEEPTSAAINYMVKNSITDGIYMVYDLGGGTFDVSIIEKIENIPVVLATAGNNYLGGDNFDNMLAHYFVEVLNNRAGYSIDLDVSRPEDAKKFRQLVLLAENVKKNLTSEDTYTISRYDVFKDNSCIDLEIEDFSRKQFEDIIKEKIVTDSFNECEKALAKFKESGHSESEIDGILMVGGSCHIPLVKKALERRYVDTGRIKSVVMQDPDLAVGYGAGIVAATMPTRIEDKESGLSAVIETPFVYEGEMTISGKAEGGPFTKLTVKAGTINAESLIDTDGSFSLTIPTPEESLTYEFSNSEGNTISFTEGVDENDLIAPTPVQNETIRIEIVDLDKQEIDNYPLVERGESLPCSATHEFTINEFSTKRVVLPVKEGYREIYRLIIEPPAGTAIGSKLEVKVDVDTVANVNLSVKINGVSARGEKIFPNVKDTSSSFSELDNLFERRINNVSGDEQREVREQRTNIYREIDEAKANGDKGHYTDAVDKLETLVQELPSVKKDLTEDNFDQLEQEIFELAKNQDSIKFSKIEDDIFFGKRALKREDYVQAQERYENLCRLKGMLELMADKKTWLKITISQALSILQDAERLQKTIGDSMLARSIEEETNGIYVYLNENIDIDHIGDLSDSRADEISSEIARRMFRLSELLERTGSREINEKMKQFEGRVSKA